jgi:hypothetical protein
MGTVMNGPAAFIHMLQTGLAENGIDDRFLLIVGYLSIALFAPP